MPLLQYCSLCSPAPRNACLYTLLCYVPITSLSLGEYILAYKLCHLILQVHALYCTGVCFVYRKCFQLLCSGWSCLAIQWSRGDSSINVPSLCYCLNFHHISRGQLVIAAAWFSWLDFSSPYLKANLIVFNVLKVLWPDTLVKTISEHIQSLV